MRLKQFTSHGLLLLLLVATLSCLVSGAEPKLERLPLGSTVAEGWLKSQLTRSKAGMGGHLDELEPDMIGKPFIDRGHKRIYNADWCGEISGTYWCGLVQLAFTLNDDELKKKAAIWVHKTIALQEEDGYLGNYLKTDNRLEDYSAWAGNWCYRALLAWYEATGEQKVLDAVHRGLLWFVKNWDGQKKTNYVGPVLIESMIYVWLKTGDKKLGDWCVDYLQWLDKNDHFHHGFNSLLRPKLEYSEDHTVAFGENVKNPGLIWLYSNNPEHLKASQNGIRQIMEQCWQCNGAPVSNLEFLAPPSAIHETEYCNFATYLNTFSWMSCVTGESVWGDRMEKLFFNGVQGARKKDERAIAYNSAPNQFFATMSSALFGTGKTQHVYAPNFPTACCPAQSVRVVPEYVRALVMRDNKNNLFLPMYGPCRSELKVNDKLKVTLQEETNYPFDEEILLKVKTTAPWDSTIHLHLPQWCDQYTVELNGTSQQLKANNGWLALKGTWHEDTIRIKFVMEPKAIAAKDAYFKENPLTVIECGPLVFSIKINETWRKTPGEPRTPLPKEWSWYEAVWKDKVVFYSLLPKVLKDPKCITKKKVASEYPWEESPIRLLVPMVRSHKHVYPQTQQIQLYVNTFLPFENPVTPDEGAGEEIVEMVPYGCTNLRITCQTVAKEK